MTHTRSTLGFEGQSVQKLVLTNGRTDRQTEGRTLPIALPSRLTRSVVVHTAQSG